MMGNFFWNKPCTKPRGKHFLKFKHLSKSDFYNYCHIFERKRNSSTENIGKMEHLANFQQIFKGSYSRKYQLLRQSSRKSGW